MAVAWARTRGMSRCDRVDVDPFAGTIRLPGTVSSIASIVWEVPTHGTVIGTLFNDRGALAEPGDAVNSAPYNMPPQPVVPYIKPSNTWVGCGVPIVLPANLEEVEIGASLGIVIGATGSHVPEASALDVVAGYTVVNDISAAHPSVFQPAIQQRCRDGFCPIGPWIIASEEVATPDALDIRVFVNSVLRATHSTAGLVRSVARLVADISQFMTLSAGDVVLAGGYRNAPHARAGDRMRIEIDRVGSLENLLLAEVRS